MMLFYNWLVFKVIVNGVLVIKECFKICFEQHVSDQICFQCLQTPFLAHVKKSLGLIVTPNAN
jgi:hypothetical protein